MLLRLQYVRQQGFTLVELVVVIIVLGILAITVMPRFADKSIFNQTGFKDQVQAVLQHARKTAIANRRYVCVTTTASTVSLQLDPRLPDGLASPSCTVNVAIPGSNDNSLSAPTGVTLSPATMLRFDPLGRASATVSFSVAGQNVTVEQETGYVH